MVWVSGGSEMAAFEFVRYGFGAARAYVYGGLDLAQFVQQAFGALELERDLLRPNAYHVEVQIQDAVVVLELSDPPKPTAVPSSIYVYVPDVDAAFQRALAAGASPLNAPEEKPYEERSAAVHDTFGNIWYISTYQKKPPLS